MGKTQGTAAVAVEIKCIDNSDSANPVKEEVIMFQRKKYISMSKLPSAESFEDNNQKSGEFIQEENNNDEEVLSSHKDNDE